MPAKTSKKKNCQLTNTFVIATNTNYKINSLTSQETNISDSSTAVQPTKFKKKKKKFGKTKRKFTTYFVVPSGFHSLPFAPPQLDP